MMNNGQRSFLSIGMERKKLKAEKFLDEMEQVVPWDILIDVIKPYYTVKAIGRRKTDLLMLLKIYFLQQWYNLSDPGVEEAVYDRNSFQKFLGIDLLSARIPDETTILNFRHLLEQNELSEKFFNAVNGSLEDKGLLMRRGTLVDATIILASGSTKNKTRKRDPEMSSTKKGVNYFFGMKAHTGTDMESGLVHTLGVTKASVSDIDEFENLLHGDEKIVGGDKGYASDKKKKQFRKDGIQCIVLNKAKRNHKLSSKQKKNNRKYSSLRSKVEHPFNVVKNLWGHRRVRYRGLRKNLSQYFTLFTLANLYKVRYQLICDVG